LRAVYDVLYALLGTTWGSPSDATKFKLPDLRGRAPAGADSNLPFAGNEGMAQGTRSHRHGWSIESDVQSSGANSTQDVGGHQHAGVGGGGALTDYAGSHGHNINVVVWGHVSSSGQTGYAGPGWTGLNYIIGSGKLSS
jgi:microcystin-dependent protein